MSPTSANPKNDLPPVEVIDPDGRSPVLLVCEHASNRIPAQYDGLGVDEATAHSHVAWDPGARAVAVSLSGLLDAPLVASTVSRLVYDCNRPPEAAGAMPEKSEAYDIPGNHALTNAARANRVNTVYDPFCKAVTAAITATAPKAMVTIHSFTPVFNGHARQTEIGILHDNDSRLADALLGSAANHTALCVARNRPYGPEDGVTHTLKEHGLKNGLMNVMIEIRNDLIATPKAQQEMARMMAGWLAASLGQLGVDCPVAIPVPTMSKGQECQNSL